MPREQINYPDLGQKFLQQVLRAEQARGEGVISGNEPWNDSSLHVSWLSAGSGVSSDGDGFVQIGFEVDLNYLELAKNLPNGRTDDRTTMWTSTFSPAEIDRLIRVLKKARRKAFKSLG